MSENKKNGTTENQLPDSLYPTEELRDKKKTPQSIYIGVCVAYGWKQGKMVTEAEYDEAIKKFSDSPIGKKVK